ncbi:hypothetical protein [Bradyrhizobium sp.]|uniref:hypothetical protein n=1 Tax=Bradyrhizobium sp. TaxID=376 RepID=UPI0025C22EEA|nr:hypothetical protein [Bradyrhizobium sp.]
MHEELPTGDAKVEQTAAVLVERYQPVAKRLELQRKIIFASYSQIQRDALMTSLDLHRRPVPGKGTACLNWRRIRRRHLGRAGEPIGICAALSSPAR